MFQNYQMNTIPTATQPYGYPFNPYYNNFQSQQQPQSTQAMNTNKIFVSGIDEVRTKMLPPNSEMVYLDNDNALLYEKIVDAKGQFEVKTYELSEKTAQNSPKQPVSMDLSGYVKIADFEAIKAELKSLKETVLKNSVTAEIESIKKGG